MHTSKAHTAKKGIFGRIVGDRRISARFRNINVVLFIFAFCVMTGVMVAAFNSVIDKISSEYATRYAYSAAETLSAHINNEIGIITKAAHSNTVAEWLADESDNDKKERAYGELAGIVGDLYSYNMYIGFAESLNEYKIEPEYVIDDVKPISSLDENASEDAWYFKCISSNKDYVLSVNIDHFMQRKRVWLDYKITRDGKTLGVICTGLEFAHVAGELFSNFDGSHMRGLIIDENGIIHMDSSLMTNQEFLYDLYEMPIEKLFPDPAISAVIDTHLKTIGGYTDSYGEPVLARVNSFPYNFLTINRINFTNWSFVIFSSSSAFFDMTYFLPVSATILLLLILFAFASNAANYRLLFLPLHKLEMSLSLINDDKNANVFGIERNDELGHLAQTIQDLFRKANVDALTGIYNRRFMENSLGHIMDFLARSNGILSVFMIDIDLFKKFNDTYGHDEGDKCLRSVAQILSASITRSNDFIARYGGEEFAVILPNTDEAGARVVAEKLLKSVRDLNIPHSGNAAAPYVTVSIGVTSGKVAHLQGWESFMKRADEALYASKNNGRNQCTFMAM